MSPFKNLLEAALNYAAHGLPVFPVHSLRNGECSCGKRECRHAGKHPRTPRGFHDATIDPGIITLYWERWPDANIGIPTGPDTGLCVIDVDPRNGGEESWTELQSVYGPIAETVSQKTGGGGWHYFYKDPGIKLPPHLAQGIDLKASGGYILVPPSGHVSGGQYAWLLSDALEALRQLDDLPAWVIKVALAHKPSQNSEPSRSGNRNTRLTSIGGGLRRKGMSEDEIAVELHSRNLTACDPPLNQNEVGSIAHSVSRYTPHEASSARNGHKKGKPQWPEPLAEAAYHGLAGEIVRMIEPHSEADPAALLIQFLVFTGNVVGRSAYFKAEDDHHYTTLFAAIVGDSSKSRKGTSLSRIKRIFGEVDPDWSSKCITNGLSSGEGLIWAVRDASESLKSKGSKTERIEDPGVTDKRLLLLESEFARVLQSIEREKNTLSAIIRHAFDSGDLGILTKNNSVRTTNAHISMVAHITQQELTRMLSDTAIANGFANRFLWVSARRSRCLPNGGRMDLIDWEPAVKRLRGSVEFGRTLGEIERDENASRLWDGIYYDLSEGLPGLFGAVTSRGEALVMRVACVYAMLDCSNEVRIEHLRAALAVWRYCQDSARYIFGDSLGHPLADQILQALRAADDGLTKTDIRNHFNRNRSADDLDEALAILERHGLARWVSELTGGKDAVRWFAAKNSLLAVS